MLPSMDATVPKCSSEDKTCFHLDVESVEKLQVIFYRFLAINHMHAANPKALNILEHP